MSRYAFLYSAIFSLLIVAGYPQAAVAEEANGSDQMVPLTSAAMATASGGSEADIQSDVTGNSMGNAYAGNISGVNISNNSGLTTSIQNTGNQVSIATATVVNITFH